MLRPILLNNKGMCVILSLALLWTPLNVSPSSGFRSSARTASAPRGVGTCPQIVMKKTPLVFALMLLASVTAAAQTSAAPYRFDNFDVKDGVRVVVPPAPAKPTRGKLRLTARTTAPAAQTPSQSPAQTSGALRSAEVTYGPTLSM